MLQIYSTLTRTKEPFTPIEPGKVRMYVCGMTVYDYCHLGHAMAMVVFDVVVRYFRECGYEVTYVRNITDVDDKIFRRANENKEDFRRLTARFIDAMHEDLDALGVQRPTLEPRATETMDQIVPMIERLMASGYAYLGDNGDVYYDVSKFDGYGKLSGKRVDELRVGARVEVDEAKDDPLDRVLWKAAKPGEASWESPWGPGRPGWDIECAAMSTHHLGANFDIHGGGIDLQFPHHENEIAQAEADTGEHFANLWMHNGHVRIDDEKMSKSLGNFFTVRDILKQYPAEVVRYFMVASHYRSPLSYSDHQLDGARSALTRLYTAMRGLPASGDAPDGDYETRFRAAMDDDFNTPEALAVLFDLAREINRAREEPGPRAARLAGLLHRLGGVLGLLQADPDIFLKGSAAAFGDLSHEEIDRLVDERNRARACKDWAKADRIRDRLDSNGVVLEDSSEGSIWRRKT